jgi:hypothetical protein
MQQCHSKLKVDDFYYTILFTGNERSSPGYLTEEDLVNLAMQLQ